MNELTPKDWLTQEDKDCYEGRLERLNWLVYIGPAAEYWTFAGGETTKALFEEARYCFVYGQFLASIVLGFSYIERTLAALLFRSGMGELERANVNILFKETLKLNWISPEEFKQLNAIRTLRNAAAHYRSPGYAENIERRSVQQDHQPYAIFEDDARLTLEVVMRLTGKNAL